MPKKLKSFTIYAIVEMDVSLEIESESLNDALIKAKDLKETDFVKPLGEWNDGAMKIRGVYDSQATLLHDR